PMRMLPDAIGAYWVALLVAVTRIPRFDASVIIALIGAVLFLAPILLFTHLHVVHPYYQTANAIFVIVSAATILSTVLKAGRWRMGLIALVCIIVGQANVFVGEGLPLIMTNHRTSPHYLAAVKAREMIPSDRGLFVFGVDWSSEVHYYAQRKGVAFAPW